MAGAGLGLETPLTELKGVGQVVEHGLSRLGLHTVRDLLNYFPKRWDDFSNVDSIANIHPGLVTVKGRIESIAQRRSFRARKLSVTEAIIADDTGTIRAVWFNQPYVKNQLQEGEQYLLSGKFEFKNNYLSLQNPAIEPYEETARRGKIVPIYGENNAITSKLLSRLLGQVSAVCEQLEDVLPAVVVQAEKLMPYGQAVAELHRPTSMASLTTARDRLAFEELFMLITTGLALKRDLLAEPGVAIEFDAELVKALLAGLSFKLTNDQKKAAWTILKDMTKPCPMNRLLEGDVGSGKTIVALLAAYSAIKHGYQVALMVPTEILARQHYNTAQQILGQHSIGCDVLLGSMKAADKKAAKAALAAGETDFVIGTHALLQEGVTLPKLGLVIIDEQHRFGVGQRRLLKAQADVMPHVLTMTATPIPRSMALVVYGELDMTVIAELPPGRKPVITRLVREDERTKVYEEVDGLIAQGQQAFVVCPLIDESDALGAKSVTAEYNRLHKGVFAHRKLGLLHGKLKTDEKERIMQDFAAGKIDIVIATTVIEVGVDVPNATVMMIESADRFGLAALHQLRGRVGRRGQQSYCYLLSETDNPTTLQRLRAMERSHDGFRLSQIDLEMRGPGEIYGARQHGVLDLRMANIMDTKLIARVRARAESFLMEVDMVEYPHMLKRLSELKAITTLD